MVAPVIIAAGITAGIGGIGALVEAKNIAETNKLLMGQNEAEMERLGAGTGLLKQQLEARTGIQNSIFGNQLRSFGAQEESAKEDFLSTSFESDAFGLNANIGRATSRSGFAGSGFIDTAKESGALQIGKQANRSADILSSNLNKLDIGRASASLQNQSALADIQIDIGDKQSRLSNQISGLSQENEILGLNDTFWKSLF